MTCAFKTYQAVWFAGVVLCVGTASAGIAMEGYSWLPFARTDEPSVKEYECHYKCGKCGYSVTTKRMLSPDERKCPICGGQLFFRGTSG